jgi:putative ABC transport system permease protein
MFRYVLADLLRNPRRTSSAVVGVTLGVGLFCGVLFFIDGLAASMTQRAVAPLTIDMQRVVAPRAATGLELAQTVRPRPESSGRIEVTLELRHTGTTPAHEVTIRSVPAAGLVYEPGSARVDGNPVPGGDRNPFAHGPARTGHNLGTLAPGTSHRLTYRLSTSAATGTESGTVATSTCSSRESVAPIAADAPAAVGPVDLADRIAHVDGVAQAFPLSIADLGTDAMSARTPGTGGRTVRGPAKIFGFDAGYAERDPSITVVDGELTGHGAVLSAETARALDLGVGDIIEIALPDGSGLRPTVTGIADLSRARSLFSSRRGGDLETFVYTPNAVILSPEAFSTTVFPAYERAAAASTGRFKNPPIREVDITVDRELLDADPATAAVQTERIARDVMAIAGQQDHLLDNVSNTLHVASADAAVAKRFFVFLGVPGALLAALLAAYAGHVLADAQRRENATVRIRGGSGRHLRGMLAIRTWLLTSAGAVLGLGTGYAAAAAILGPSSLARAGATALIVSAVTGTVGGFVATGLALYLTGRRSVDREINEDRARLATRPPLWRRARLDLSGLVIVAVGTVWALRTNAFDGAPGSVYYGRSVELRLGLLVLPVAVWITGSLAAARLVAHVLERARPASDSRLDAIGPALFRRSVGRRPWAVGNGVVVIALIVALVTGLAGLTASYANAKTRDARYANGADLRISPGPAAGRTYPAAEGTAFDTPSIAQVTPVVYGSSNVILRSARTSDPANLAAIDPTTFAAVAPLEPERATVLHALDGAGDVILISTDMADFLQAGPGDTLHVLLARSTADQTEITLTIGGLFQRLPGFPDGVDAVIDLGRHTAAVPAKTPDFFLASTVGGGDAPLEAAVAELRAGPAADDALRIDTRTTTLDRDQSSLTALNLAGLVRLDSGFALAMTTVAVAIFVFGLLLQRRREYVVLRAQGLPRRTVGALIGAEATAVAVLGALGGLVVGAAMGYYFVAVLRPLFVLTPHYTLPPVTIIMPVLLLLLATAVSTALGARFVNSLQPTELLRDE